MLPCKKIICPTDFSDASKEALKAAVELAAQFSAELLLVHVLPPVMNYIPADWTETPRFDLPSYERQQAEDALAKLDELSQQQIPEAVNRRILVRQGSAAHEILEAAAEENADLIVIASHGMTGWRRYLYGSVTQRVIHHTPCSVLVVKSIPAE
jgi:nucleotide-binding universal stress UspA family protein